MNEVKKWVFNTQLNVNTINNLGTYLGVEDIDVDKSIADIVFSVTPSLSNDGIISMPIKIEHIKIAIEYSSFDGGEVKNGQLILDNLDNRQKLNYIFNTKELRFSGDGGLMIAYSELYFGKNELQIDLG